MATIMAGAKDLYWVWVRVLDKNLWFHLGSHTFMAKNRKEITNFWERPVPKIDLEIPTAGSAVGFTNSYFPHE